MARHTFHDSLSAVASIQPIAEIRCWVEGTVWAARAEVLIVVPAFTKPGVDGLSEKTDGKLQISSEFRTFQDF
jgi:hypothetical protein